MYLLYACRNAFAYFLVFLILSLFCLFVPNPASTLKRLGKRSGKGTSVDMVIRPQTSAWEREGVIGSGASGLSEMKPRLDSRAQPFSGGIRQERRSMNPPCLFFWGHWGRGMCFPCMVWPVATRKPQQATVFSVFRVRFTGFFWIHLTEGFLSTTNGLANFIFSRRRPTATCSIQFSQHASFAYQAL